MEIGRLFSWQVDKKNRWYSSFIANTCMNEVISTKTPTWKFWHSIFPSKMMPWTPSYLDSRFPNGCSVWRKTRTQIIGKKSWMPNLLQKGNCPRFSIPSNITSKKTVHGPQVDPTVPPKSVRWVPCTVIRDNWLGPCGTSTSWNFPMEFCHWLRKEEFPGWMAIRHLGLCED